MFSVRYELDHYIERDIYHSQDLGIQSNFLIEENFQVL
jgi:hypothetical protein